MAGEERFAFVCQNVDCLARGGQKLLEQIAARVKEKGCTDIQVKPYMCFGACQDGPNVVLFPDKVWYSGVKEEHIEAIANHICGGESVEAIADKVDPSLRQLIYELLAAGLF